MKNQSNQILVFFVFILLIKFFLIYAFVFPWRGTPWAGHMHVDIWSWIAYLKECAAGGFPYVDFSKEYPVGIGVFFWLISFIVDGHNHNLLLNFFIIFFTLVDFLNVIVFRKILIKHNARKPLFYSFVYAILPTNVVLTPFRYESLVNLFVFLAYYFFLNNKKGITTCLYAIGTTFKWYPAIFFFAQEWKEFFVNKKILPRLKSALLFAFTFLLINLPFIAFGLYFDSIQNWLNTYFFHVERNLYSDTPFGALALWLGYIPYEKYASLGSLALMVIIFFSKPSLHILAKTAAVIAAALIWNRVYSTQFHLWFIPFVLIYLSILNKKSLRNYLFALILILELVNVAIYPFIFTYNIIETGGLGNGQATLKGGYIAVFFTSLVLLRPLLLIELIVGLFKSQIGPSRFEKNSYRIIRLLYLPYIIFLILFTFSIYSQAKNNQTLFNSMIEAEDLRYSGNASYSLYHGKNTQKLWSNNSFMRARDNQIGSYVEHQVDIQESGYYQLILYFSKTNKNGIIKISLNNKTLKQKLDLFTARGVHNTGPIPVTPLELSTGQHTLRIEVVGKNKNSRDYNFGFDGVIIKKLI